MSVLYCRVPFFVAGLARRDDSALGDRPLEADPARCRAESEVLWQLLERASDRVEPHGWGAAYADLGDLHPADALAVCRELGQEVRRELGQGLQPALGWDSAKFTAQAAARRTQPGRLRAVEGARQRRFLRPLPVRLLPLSGDTLQRLGFLGLRCLGQYAALPPAAVWQQFGRAGKLAQRCARGEDDRPVVPRWQAPQLSALAGYFLVVWDINRAAKSLDTRSPIQAAQTLLPDFPLPDSPLPWSLLAELLPQMDGLPRHLSIHVGGLVVTAAPLVEVVPLERATMPGRVVVQWDKEGVEDAGLIKIDLLSLRTLGAVDEALHHIREQRGVELDVDRLPLDDPVVYDLLRRADTVGCFQVESRAQAQMLPKLRPTRFEDIVVGVALIRPGPIQGGMVHPYLRRRQGLEPVTYAHPLLEPALAETLGVVVFQEQVLRVAMAVAGFSPAEADQLRRAMSRVRSEEAMAALRGRFLAGARANGLDEATAVEIWGQLAGFAGFGFCKSHAAAFALLAYQTLYLKAHYPDEFFCALLNHQPLGFYPPEVLVGDTRRHGVPVLGPDVNRSVEVCTLEAGNWVSGNQESGNRGLGIRLGLGYVRGLGETWQTRIVERRGERPFRDLADFCPRTRLPRPAVENLVRAGAVDGFGTRRELLWTLGGLVYQEDGLDLDVPVEAVDLPALGDAERLAWEYELLGLAPGTHVTELYRDALRRQGVLTSRALAGRRDGERVRVAGWAVVRQRPPTARGMLFVSLEDEEGLINLVVRPDVYERYRDTLRDAPLLWVEGRVQREGEALSVLVHRAAALVPGSLIEPEENVYHAP